MEKQKCQLFVGPFSCQQFCQYQNIYNIIWKLHREFHYLKHLKGKKSSGKLLKQIVQSILIFFRQMKVVKLDGFSFVWPIRVVITDQHAGHQDQGEWGQVRGLGGQGQDHRWDESDLHLWSPALGLSGLWLWGLGGPGWGARLVRAGGRHQEALQDAGGGAGEAPGAGDQGREWGGLEDFRLWSKQWMAGERSWNYPDLQKDSSGGLKFRFSFLICFRVR